MDKYFLKLKERIQRSVFINDALWEELKTHGTLIHVNKNQNLIQQSSKSRNVYFIASGSFMHSLISASSL